MSLRLSCLKNISFDYLAFSCGTDSVALAHALRYKQPTLLHFNHKLIEEDDIFEQKARNFAKKFGFKIEVGYASENYSTGSVEAWCRNQRYKWFSKFCGDILMAHTLSDAVESYIMRTFKGNPEFQPIPVSSQFGEARVVRPMMLSSSEDISAYLNKNELNPFTTIDPLNLDTSKMRNWVRLMLLPLIRERTDISLNKVVKKIVLEQYEKFRENNLTSNKK